MKNTFLKFYFILLLFSFCKKNDSISQESLINKDKKLAVMDDKYLRILKKQINYGANRSEFDIEDGLEIEPENYKMDNCELKVLDSILFSILLSNGYIKPDKNNFIKKNNSFFNRQIDFNSNTTYLYINEQDKCNKKFVDYIDKASPKGFYLTKENNFISQFYYIPEIINYQKESTLIAQIEDSMDEEYTNDKGLKIQITKWKDIPDLGEKRKKNIQTVVARNMYLFTDSRAYFKWLILNDKYFMQSLVTTFGYYDDKELLKWVVENTKFDSNSPDELDKIFWNKKCDGTVKLNLEIFPVLKEIITPEEPQYLEALKAYAMYLLEEKSKRNELSLQDRAKLLAHLVYFGEQYRYDNNYNDQSFFMQRIFLFDLDGSIEKEIQRNNFYNLPNYKNLYKKSEEYQDKLTDENGG